MARRLPVALVVLATCSGCGSVEPPAPVACDRFAEPGERSAQELADALRPGEVGCLREGDYEADTVLDVRRDGRPGAPITIRSAAGGGARLRGTVSIEADHIRLVALEVQGNGEANAVKVYGDDVTLEGNRITTGERPYSCIILGGDPGIAERVVVRRNLLYDCGSRETNKDHGIYAARVRGGRIEENVIVRPATYAMQLYPDARDVTVVRNHVDGSDALRGGFIVGGGSDTASSSITLERNVVEDAENALRTLWEGPVGEGNVARGNCLGGSGGEEPEGIDVTDPADPGDDACELDLEPLLRRAGVRDP